MSFEPHKAFEEAAERHEHAAHGGGRGARWVPIAAAILAVLAAIANLVGSQRSTSAIVSKNEAILFTARASDTYNEYEARSIKQHIYEAALATGSAREPAKLAAVAKHERTAKVPVLEKARGFEEEAKLANERSERSLKSFETIEVGVTFLEVAIVLVSISALASTPFLTIVAVLASAVGIVIFLMGLGSH